MNRRFLSQSLLTSFPQPILDTTPIFQPRPSRPNPQKKTSMYSLLNAIPSALSQPRPSKNEWPQLLRNLTHRPSKINASSSVRDLYVTCKPDDCCAHLCIYHYVSLMQETCGSDGVSSLTKLLPVLGRCERSKTATQQDRTDYGCAGGSAETA